MYINFHFPSRVCWACGQLKGIKRSLHFTPPVFKGFYNSLKKCFTHWLIFNYPKSRLFTFRDAPLSSLFLTPSLTLSHTHSFIKAINDTFSPFRNWIWYEIYRLHSGSAQVESGTQNALIALLVKHGMWRSFFTPGNGCALEYLWKFCFKNTE